MVLNKAQFAGAAAERVIVDENEFLVFRCAADGVDSGNVDPVALHCIEIEHQVGCLRGRSGDIIKYKAVRTHAAGELIGAAAAGQFVIADAADQDIVVLAAAECVVAAAAVEDVVTAAAFQHVLAGLTLEDVVANTAIDDVVATADVDGIISGFAEYHISFVSGPVEAAGLGSDFSRKNELHIDDVVARGAKNGCPGHGMDWGRPVRIVFIYPCNRRIVAAAGVVLVIILSMFCVAF